MKKNIGLLTLNPLMYNYGGILQEYGLFLIIENMGHNCEIINYLPSNELNTFSIKRGFKYFTIKKFIAKVNKNKNMKQISKIAQSESKKRHKAFDDFRNKYLKLSIPIDYSELHNKKLPYDILVCGSDQIWNPDYNRPAFFLDFAKENQRTVIYAASLGTSSHTKIQLNTYKDLMKNLDYISVREVKAKEILDPIVNKDISVVLDPTLLHSSEFWLQLTANSNKKYKKYIFCYFLNLTKEKIAASKKFAQKNNLSIITIPYLHDKDDDVNMDFGDIRDSDVGPIDFLKIISDADCVLTDSFHAAVFSLQFNKNFWVFERNCGTYNMNSRLETLLSYYGEEKRLISPLELSEKKLEDVFFDNTKIKKERQKSLLYLEKAIG